jgi:hypothetical protein
MLGARGLVVEGMWRMKQMRSKTVARSVPGLFLLLGLTACGGGGENQPTPPTVPTQPVAVNVVSALVTPSYTLDGGAFPQSEYDDGNFLLQGVTETTDTALLGSSHDANPVPVRVVQGEYDVLFQHETGAGVPQNVKTPVQTGEVINSDRALPVAVTTWSVTPSFSHSAGTFPQSEYDDGRFFLRPVAGGEDIFLGNSHSASPDAVSVIEGSYDVIYSLETGGDLVPNNQAAVVLSGQNIAANAPLAVNANSVRFQFNASLDAAPFPASQYQMAEFFLRNNATGDRVALGTSVELPLTLFVVEGTYDIVYHHVQGDALPINSDAVIASDVLIDGVNNSQTIDISSVAVTPAFTLNGSPFPQDEYNDANFYLRGTNNHTDEMYLGASEVAPVAVRVINSDFDTDVNGGGVLFGNYDVMYRHETGEGVPQNSNALVLSGQVLNADGALNIAINTVNVAGVFTLNGNNFPNDASNSVRFLLRDANNDSDEFHFGFSNTSNEAVMLIAGTYHVVMDHIEGEDVPQNTMHEVDFNNLLDEDQDLRVNVPAVRVDPTFTLDGMAFPASYYQRATFYLREKHEPFNLIFLGESYKDNAPVMVIKENYDAVYEYGSGEQVPQNIKKNVGLVDL